MHVIKKTDKRWKAGEDLLKAANEFWKACQDEGQYGAVQWLQGENNELVVFTRGEYRETIMSNIDTIGTKEYFFSEVMDRREDDRRSK